MNRTIGLRVGIALIAGANVATSDAQTPRGVDTTRYDHIALAAQAGPSRGELVFPLQKLHSGGAFSRPERAWTDEPDTFNFRVNNDFYHIGPTGAGIRIDPSTSLPLQLPVDTHFFIERLAFNEYQGDPVFTFQESEGETGASRVVRLESATMRTMWVVNVGGFNLAPPLQMGSYLFVGAFAFVGKVDLASGRLAWQHTDLYQTEGFNSFENIELRGDTVLFFGNNGKVLRANVHTGERERGS